jgi:type III restriction enzyme
VTRKTAADFLPHLIEAVPYKVHTVLTDNHLRFNTSRPDRWDTSGPPPKNHVNWVVLDIGWEGEFCRVAESHPRVIAYTKNHNLGLEGPYRYGSETRLYRPDFIALVDDGHGPDDPLHLVVEIRLRSGGGSVRNLVYGAGLAVTL